MATPSPRRQQGGFGCEFIERPPEAFQVDCPICLSILREPYLISCCGYNFCQLCIERVQLQKGSCPTCNEASFSIVPNKGLKRSLHAYKVCCPHKKEGCQWTGELGELEKHLNKKPNLCEQLNGCPLTIINCDFCYAGCKVQLPRKSMPTHLAENVVVHMSLMAVHYQEVTHKKLSEKDKEIEKIKGELAERKEENVKMSNLGDELARNLAERNEQIAKLKDEISEKLKENTQRIEALEEENEALKRSLAQKTEAKQKLEPILPTLPAEFTMTDFDHYKQNKECWCSPPFYTHPRGYKMCLKVSQDVNNDGNRILVGTYLMCGDFDHLLNWPFQDSVAFEMLNQLEDREHYRFTAVFNGKSRRGCRVTDGEKAKNGCGGYVAYDYLDHNPAKHCHYLKDDCLQFRVTHVVCRDVLQLQRQCLGMESRVCMCPFEFTVADFERLRREHDTWHSPSFYTHTAGQAGGYRMCLEICASDNYCSTHLRVGIHLMWGEFDNFLKWPFRGNVTVQLLNQQQNKGHYEMTIHYTDTTPDSHAGRVTGCVMNRPWGWSQFISYDKLTHDPATKCEYLCNDCLRFRITVKVKSKVK